MGTRWSRSAACWPWLRSSSGLAMGARMEESSSCGTPRVRRTFAAAPAVGAVSRRSPTSLRRGVWLGLADDTRSSRAAARSSAEGPDGRWETFLSGTAGSTMAREARAFLQAQPRRSPKHRLWCRTADSGTAFPCAFSPSVGPPLSGARRTRFSLWAHALYSVNFRCARPRCSSLHRLGILGHRHGVDTGNQHRGLRGEPP